MLSLFTYFDAGMAALGPLLVVMGTTIVNAVGVAYFRAPVVGGEREPSLATRLATDAIGVWIWFNIIFNWAQCVRTSPGVPPKQIPKELLSSSNDGGAGETTNNPRPGVKTCKKCNDAFKPARAHHCSVCGHCNMCMDHHCPWMANCVGFHNYRYFFLTLAYLELGCMFCVYVTVRYHDAFRRIRYGGSEGKAALGLTVVFMFCLGVVVGIAVFTLLSFHLYLITKGETTIEFYEGKIPKTAIFWFRAQHRHRVNPYDLGPFRNWARVFGSREAWRWFLPSFRKPEGDGVRWETCRHLVLESYGSRGVRVSSSGRGRDGERVMMMVPAGVTLENVVDVDDPDEEDGNGTKKKKSGEHIV